VREAIKLGACHRIAAGKQRDIMSKLHQFVDQLLFGMQILEAD